MKCKACGRRCVGEFCDEGCARLYAEADRTIQTGRGPNGIRRNAIDGPMAYWIRQARREGQ